MSTHTDVKLYILLGISVVLTGFAIYFHVAREHVFHALLQEKIVAVGNDADYVRDVVAYLVEQDGGWDVERYRDVLAFLITRFDATPNIYAELLDEQFNTLSDRIIPVDDSWWFDLKQHPNLIEALKTKSSGSQSVVCDLGNATLIKVYLHWHWLPTEGTHDNRVLFIIGLSQYSVHTQLATWMTYGLVALFGTTALLIASCIVVSAVRRKIGVI